MTDHATLAEALLAFQGNPPKIRPTAENKAFKRPDGSASKYVSLDNLVDAALPRLNEEGLIWTTLPTVLDGMPALAYRLIHAASGEVIEGTMPLCIGANATPQAQGSATTYGRRYSMMAVLGLVGDEDDDGNKGSGNGHRRPDTPAPMSDEARDTFWEELSTLADPVGLLKSIGLSTKLGEWVASDGPRIRAAIDKQNGITL